MFLHIKVGSVNIRYTTRVQTGLVDAGGVDHRAEGAGIIIVALLFLLLLGCEFSEWRGGGLFQISCGHCNYFVFVLSPERQSLA